MNNCFRKISSAFLLIFVFTTIGYTQKRPTKNVKKNKTFVKKTSPKDDNRHTLEMVFVIDTTGSMGGLIDGAKQKIWSIVNEVMKKESHPRVRVGLVAYRDKGDAYVTKITPITEDLDKIYADLMEYRAAGGGDGPENVRKALAEGLNETKWSKPAKNLAQIIFLVGDAPPHDDYEQEPDVLTTTAAAVGKNMIVNTIQCGVDGNTREIWQTIARRGEGKYFAIAQDGGVQAIETPYDKKLAELAQKIGKTYITYGSLAVQGRNYTTLSKMEMTVSNDATVAAQADRAVNKAVNSFSYDGDLIQDIENEKIKLEDVKEENLPEELKKLPPAERKKEIEKRIAERKKIRAEILELSKKRDEYIAAQRKKLGEENGFDAAVAKALNEQLLKKGIK